MTDRMSRSLSQLRMFVLLSAGILALGGFVLGAFVSHSMREQAVDDAKKSLAQYVDGVLAAHLVKDGEVTVAPHLTPAVARKLSNREDIMSVKVWRADGVLAWTSTDRERIGRRFEIGEHLRDALEGRAQGHLEALTATGEQRGEAQAGLERALEVYTPLRRADGTAIGAYEVYSDSFRLESRIAHRKYGVWLLIGGVFLALWAALVLLVRRASRLLQRQTRELRMRSAALSESYSALSESSLEAIEMLNATVEAKDPYTAGHSARVQDLAVAMGEELGIGGSEMDALRLGALFHDIGKLAVPDSILLKPGPLDHDEYRLMQTHSAEGARIVGKLSRLRSTVPTIRHHHERWDGGGYPDGLAGEDIPLTAAIVGLADAWDAMTTERPYHGALTAEEANAEVVRCRATQFAPHVVDAFLAVCDADQVPAHSAA